MNKLLLAVMATAALCTSCAPSQEAASAKFGIQLYSVRELVGNAELYAANHEQVLSDLASYGYSSIEAANYAPGKFYGVSPEQFRADLEAAGLEALSSHTMRNLTDEELSSGDFSEALAWWDVCIADHKAAGMKYIVCPSFRVPSTLEGLGTYCRYFNEIGTKCKEAGLAFGIHNHSHEFGRVEGEKIYDFLIANTDPELVFFQMDVYWAVRGGAAPVHYFREHPGIFTVLHIKDDKELGESGMVGFDAIFNNVDAAGTKDYIIEIEGSSVGDIMESCRISAEYLKNGSFGF